MGWLGSVLAGVGAWVWVFAAEAAPTLLLLGLYLGVVFAAEAAPTLLLLGIVPEPGIRG